MARVVITIEDTPGGGVECRSEPNMRTMVQMDMSGNQLTDAHAYALKALNAIHAMGQEAKRARGAKMGIWLPEHRRPN